MPRSLAALAIAAFVATAGPMPARAQDDAHTLSLFDPTGYVVKVQFFQNGILKEAITLTKTAPYVSVALKGSLRLTGTVATSVKGTPITARDVTLVTGQWFTLTVESDGAGGYRFRSGP